MKKSVCIIFGGKSEEYEVSLRSAYCVLESIDKGRYDISKILVTKDGKWLRFFGSNQDILNDNYHYCTEPIKIDFTRGCIDNIGKIDIAFPVMHGTFCEDGRLQGIFESLGIKCVGCDSFSSFLCMDKHLTKLVAKSVNVNVVPWVMLTKNDALPSKITYPVFVKPCSSGSSRGASRVLSQLEMEKALNDAFSYSDKALIEDLIDGLECEIGVLVLPCGELILSQVGSLSYNSDFYDYETKYIKEVTEYNIPAKIPTFVSDRIKEYAKILFKALGCTKYARLDFFVDKNNNVYFNEINTLPGFTSISMYPMLFENLGYSKKEIIDILLNF